MASLCEAITPTDSRAPPTSPAPFFFLISFWTKLSNSDQAAMCGMSAEDTIRSMRENTDVRNERERLKVQNRQSLDLMTTSILNTQADTHKSISDGSEARTLLRDKEKGTAEIRSRLAVLETRQHQLLDLSAPVASAPCGPRCSAAFALCSLRCSETFGLCSPGSSAASFALCGHRRSAVFGSVRLPSPFGSQRLAAVATTRRQRRWWKFIHPLVQGSTGNSVRHHRVTPT